MRIIRWEIVVFGVLTAFACTARNKAYCGDGTCADPARPYCDVDGAFGGVPGTCLAVQCAPGTFAACRGDLAITCTSSGDDYDQTLCPLGCDASADGCKECITNTQCGDSRVCDLTTNACRSCKADDECDSRVCDPGTGSCVPESSLVYAAPNGTGTCSLSQPCSIASAIMAAVTAPVTPTVRMLPGTYTSSIHVQTPTSQPLQVVASGANIVVIGSVPAVGVDGGASVVIRGLSTTSERQIQCSGTSGSPSSLSIRDASLAAVGAGGTAIETTFCALRMTLVGLSVNSDPLGAHEGSSIVADRVLMHNNTTSNLNFVAVGNVDVTFSNSVFEATDVVVYTLGPNPPDVRLLFSQTTFTLRGTAITTCSNPVTSGVSVVFENSIFAELGASDVVTGSGGLCTFRNSLFSRQTAPPAGVIVADPQFIDEASHNLHLKATSPAIDGAPAASVNPDHDLDGTPRPQGATSDMGAYEFRP